jgi:chromosome segregation ATPase
MKHRTCKLSIPLTAALVVSASAGHAGAYRWVDESGRIHYSDAVPSGQAQRGYKIYDAEGRQVGAAEAAKTRDEYAAAQRQQALAEAQAHRDRVLLATFTSEEDLEYAREERLATAESALAIAKEKLAELETQLAQLESSTKQEPARADLSAQRDDVRLRISELQADVLAKQQEQQAIKDAFAADLARFRELKARR